MPCLVGKFSAAGLILNLACLPPGTWTPGTNPVPQYYAALVDTGAGITSISPKVAQALGLIPIGLTPVSSVSHLNVPTNTYLIDLGLLFGTVILWQSSIRVLEFQPSAGSPYEMLLGRDVICQGTLTLSFDGHWSFSI